MNAARITLSSKNAESTSDELSMNRITDANCSAVRRWACPPSSSVAAHPREYSTPAPRSSDRGRWRNAVGRLAKEAVGANEAQLLYQGGARKSCVRVFVQEGASVSLRSTVSGDDVRTCVIARCTLPQPSNQQEL